MYVVTKINIGIDVSHEVYYQKGSNNTFISYLRAYGEYQFYQNKKATFLVGVRPYGFRFEYTPTDWYQFLNDPIDGKQHTHFIGGVSLYTSADIRIREKCHLVFGLGLDKKFSTKSGLLPRNLPMIFMLDFRAPFPKFMMKKNSKVQNYY
ncbi:MAG: hypothetical protein KF900_05830 [Bacteroidetes bacterium]|nr:hypothetical protein [Bacteroidota bacterium]